MTSYTLPPADLSGPLSKRAVQILRELEGLRLLDPTVPVLSEEVSNGQPANKQANQRIEPTLHNSGLEPKAQPRPTKMPSSKNLVFSKQDYLDDVKGNLLTRLIMSFLLLTGLIFSIFYTVVELSIPTIKELKSQYEILPRLQSELKSVSDGLVVQSHRYGDLVDELAKLESYFPDAHQAYASYGGFLSLLESQNVNVLSQRGTITNSSTNPLMQADLANQSKSSELVTKVGGKAVSRKLGMLSGEMRAGLNYYHLGFTFEGSYVGYLTARQALVNENPNLIIHSESVITPKEGDPLLQITAYISIPFVHTP